MTNKYEKSEEFLKRAEKTVPLGTQTFSKSKTQLPHGVSPYFATHAKGSYLWDVDGNKYVDFVNALGAITLGYNDTDIMDAVKAQLEKGTIFSLAHEIEFLVAEKICEMVPCAEMVRFGKNGSDTTAAAIRLARAYTKKEHVFVCGYHGWQDWYIGSTTKNLGVPVSTQNLTHSFLYNDIDSLEKLFKEHNSEVAAVILEPVNITAPKDNFLEKVKSITQKNDALLIFDETVTGFRYANGGAQAFFNVIPDIATFGKGIANGYPLSAIAGKAKYMKLMEEIFFSFTFGGETLSLAASYATLKKLQEQPILEHINKIGEEICARLNNLIKEYDFSNVFSVSGYPVLSYFNINDCEWANALELKTLFVQEMFAQGILTLGTHNMSYSHNLSDVDWLLKGYHYFFEKVKEAKIVGIKNLLNCEVSKPLFKIR